MTGSYNLQNIRALLINGFTDLEQYLSLPKYNCVITDPTITGFE